MKKVIIILIIIFFLGLIIYENWSQKNNQANNQAQPTSTIPTQTSEKQKEETSKIVIPGPKQPAEIQENVLLTVPYTRQAPFSVWDALHEDACEEASLLMVYHFLAGDNFDSKQQADNEIKAMVAYEEKSNYGLSITLEQLNNIAINHLGMKTGRIQKNATIDDVKRELSEGKPIIIGAAGKLLPNPYFRNGGPIYHMLVIKGYDSKNFITNDPGTREGDGFQYSFDALFNAIHDWNNGSDILKGGKNYLVFD